MNMKKLTTLLLAFMLAMSMLVGCSSAQKPGTTESGTSVAENSTETGTSGETAETDFSGVTLNWYYSTALFEQTAEQVAADFKAETGIIVEWENSDGGEATLKARFASGEAPDLIYLDQSAIVAWQEHLYDLSNESWVDSVYDNSLACATIDGKLYALPTATEAMGIIYNKDLFEQAEITELPRTLTALKDACQKLDAAGIQPFGECYSIWGFVSHTMLIPFAFEGDSAAFNAGLADGSKTFADLKYNRNWYDYVDMTLQYGNGTNSIAYSIDDQIADFANGKMAMIKQGTWLGAPIASVNPDINYGLLPIPLTENESDNKMMLATTNFMGVNKNSENLEAALYFMDWLVKNAQEYFVDSYRVPVPYEGMDFSNLGTLVNDMNQYVSEGKTYGTFGGDDWPAAFPESALAPFQAYCAGQANREETDRAFTDMYYSYANQ